MSPQTCRLITLVMHTYDPPRPCPDGGFLDAEPVDQATGQPPVPGDMFFDPDIGEKGDDSHWGHHLLSDAYWNLPEPRRDPLCVVLPEGTHFYLDSKQVTDGLMHEPGWTITGTAPMVTVSPSINCLGRWHGFLESGVLRSV